MAVSVVDGADVDGGAWWYVVVGVRWRMVDWFREERWVSLEVGLWVYEFEKERIEECEDGEDAYGYVSFEETAAAVEIAMGDGLNGLLVRGRNKKKKRR